MTDDQTQQQTADGQSSSRELSMRATTPPAEVPGYRLSQFLGAGAFGQVWVGLDLNTGRSVAVKFYLHRGGVNWSLLSREVKNLVQLSADRYVVQVLEVGWDANPPYYVMELVGGGSLEDYLLIHGRLNIVETVKMFRQICIGLNHCHAKGVLHCDLKPANILLGEENEPRLADFGQSRLSDDQTPALGTLFYMAPEQADLESSPDASWDVYAVGAILYRMLTGHPPHRDETVVEHIDTAGSLPKRLQRYREAIQGSPPPTRHLQTVGVDRALARIVSKCLAAKPSDRYENVQQILQDLQRRDVNRAKRPLMLLGIVGPLLILLLTSFFGYRSIEQASAHTKDALRKEAFGANQLTAAFAAQALESEIQRYYDLALDEAEGDDFQRQLKVVLEDSVIASAIGEIASKRTPDQTHASSTARDILLDAPARKQLDDLLAERLSRYTGQAKSSRQPRLATMFVTDSVGTILGIAYDQPVARSKNSAGKNFCYRTYYHGGRVDLPKSEAVIGEVPALAQTRLSAAFPSTATRAWKVAVSTPIYLGDDRSQPDAIFVVTVNLGDFKLLQSELLQTEPLSGDRLSDGRSNRNPPNSNPLSSDQVISDQVTGDLTISDQASGDRLPNDRLWGEQGANLVAVLVEARMGPDRGTILQHPLMDQHRIDGIKLEDQKYQIDTDLIDALIAGDDKPYHDPLAAAEDGGAYRGVWLAAIEPVRLPDRVGGGDKAELVNSGVEKTDLLVLVQYRLEKVLAPVNSMRSALEWGGATALLSVLAVTLALWFFVRKVDNAAQVDTSGSIDSETGLQENSAAARSARTPPSGNTETMAG